MSRNSRAIVRDFNQHFAVFIVASQRNLVSIGCVIRHRLSGIEQEVHKDLAQASLIGQYNHI